MARNSAMRLLNALLIGILYCLAATAQTKPKANDISQTVQGKVLFRDADGSVRAAPFVQILIFEPPFKDANGINTVGAADRIVKIHNNVLAAADKNQQISNLTADCREMFAWSAPWMVEPKLDWLATWDTVTTDENGKFTEKVAYSDTQDSDIYGNFLFIALEEIQGTNYLWAYVVAVRKGKSTSLIMADPHVCKESASGSPNLGVIPRKKREL